MYKSETIEGLETIDIPAGKFFMGSGVGEERERPIHEVSLDAFEMSTTPITQSQYETVMGENPSRPHKKNDSANCPVDGVRWYDALVFCNRLSDNAGLERCYKIMILNRPIAFLFNLPGKLLVLLFGFNKTFFPTSEAKQITNYFVWPTNPRKKNGFRLPTEAEWEYACRAGSTDDYCSGNKSKALTKVGWYGKGPTKPVGQKEPNAWELYDMHGNVWEWCFDRADPEYYSKSPASNPACTSYHDLDGPTYSRIIRGGGRDASASQCRSAFRGARTYRFEEDLSYLGFRVVRNKRDKPLLSKKPFKSDKAVPKPRRLPDHVASKYKRPLLLGLAAIIAIIGIIAIVNSVRTSMFTDQLVQAVARNDVKEARVLIEKGADVNVMDVLSQPLLLRSMWADSPKMFQMLIENGTNVNAKNSHGHAALHSAYGDLRIMRLLFEHGADPNIKDNKGNTPMHHALKNLKEFSSPPSKKVLKFVGQLLNNGADVNLKNNEGYTPLMYALLYCDRLYDKWHREDQLNIIKRILKEDNLDLMATNNEGKRALHMVAYRSYGVYELIKEEGGAKGLDQKTIEILDRGLDMTARGANHKMWRYGTERGRTTKEGLDKIFDDLLFILEEGDIDLNWQNESSYGVRGTLLENSIHGNLFDIVKKLIDMGADVNKGNRYNHEPPLYLAVKLAKRKNNINIIKLLLKNGADVNYRNRADTSAYDYAVEHNLSEIAKLLKAAGADTNE